MQLPPSLREAIDRELEGIALADLARASERLSHRYRAEIRDNRFHVDDEPAAHAYLTTRLPATYAAITHCLRAVTEVRPGFVPRTVLDAGAGPGTATWAAAEQWPSLEEGCLIEGSTAMQQVGARLVAGLPMRASWQTGSLDATCPDAAVHDLVLMAYVLDELAPAARDQLIPRLWQVTGDTLVIVEPGTSAGWRRILRARDQLIAAGAHILAPCPHAKRCPLSPPDWCHFSARVSRSRLHRQAKGGTVPWEDEKFIYLAASRQAPAQQPPRVIAPPYVSKSDVRLKLCQPSGIATEHRIATRAGEAFKKARKLEWGDTAPAEIATEKGTP